MSYADAVTAISGLQSYWPLTANLTDAGSGAVTLTNHGTTVGGGGPLVAGDTTSTLIGATGYLDAGDIYDLQTGYTLALWALFPSSLTAASAVMSKYDGTVNAGWEILINSGGPRVISGGNYSVVNGGPATANATDRPITYGVPQMIVTAFDGSVLRAYVNGVMSTGTAGPGAPVDNATAGFTVGARATGTGSFPIANSSIAHVAVWNRALSADEIASLWYVGTAVTYQPRRMPNV